MFRRATSCVLVQTVGVRGYRRHVIPTLLEMTRRQKLAGERLLPKRSSLLEWDFSKEINALCRRLAIEPTENIRESFISPEYAENEENKMKNLGIESTPIRNHTSLAQDGLQKLREVLSAQLKECFPYIPGQAVDSLRTHLTRPEMLVDIASQMGLEPLVLRTGPGNEIPPQLLQDTLLALFMSVRQPEDFCRRFILVQLSGKDIFDIWNPKDASFLLNNLLQQQKLPAFVPRIIGETGRNTIESLFYVGVYTDKRLIGKGAGLTQGQALDVAVRDALRRAFRITRAARSPFERMAMRTLSEKITHGFVTEPNESRSTTM